LAEASGDGTMAQTPPGTCARAGLLYVRCLPPALHSPSGRC
jgi:hypothetical protein